MIRSPPSSTHTVPRVPYTALCRSSHPVDQARLARCLREFTLARCDPTCRIAGNQRDIGLRAGLLHIGLPFFPQRAIYRCVVFARFIRHGVARVRRSEEHTSELQSLMRISYAVFCLKKKKTYISSKLQPSNTE